MVLEGLHAVKHALRFGAELTVVAVVDRDGTLKLADALAPDIVPRLEPLLREVSSAAALTVGGRPIPTGVCALAVRPTCDVQQLLRPSGAPVVLLDQPRNLSNVGAVIRAAAAAAAAGVLTTGQQDPWHPAALRGSAGLHFAQPVGTTSVEELVGSRPIIGLDAGGALLDPSRLPDDAVLVFGSERHGISAETRARCSAMVALPMQQGVSSLNLATSVAAVLMSWRLQSGWTGRP